MAHVIFDLLWRLALCALVTWSQSRVFDGAQAVIMMLLTAPLYAILIKPAGRLLAALRHQAEEAIWSDVQGNYYAFRGVPIQVIEDESHRRWVRMADVRRAIGFSASDGALQITYPGGAKAMGKPASMHEVDDALVEHLSKETSAQAGKFHQWVLREIAMPARKVRQRYGVRLPDKQFAPSE